MKVKAPPRMSSIQWFVSIAAGLAMFLLPQDAQSYFSDVYRQIFVAVVAFGIALVLLLLFKLYEPIGVAMLSSMFLTVITFAIRIGIRIYDGAQHGGFHHGCQRVRWGELGGGLVNALALLFSHAYFCPGKLERTGGEKGLLLFFPEGFRGIRMLPADFAAGDFLYFRP